MAQAFIIILKGFGVGASMLVPGISGGSAAIILGIYDQLIHALAGFSRDIRYNTQLLGLFSLGGLLGMVLAARPLLLLFSYYPAPSLYFFMGAATGSIPLLLHKARLGRLGGGLLLWPLAGAAIVLLLGALQQLPLAPGLEGPSWLFLLLAGLAGSIAFVLPGISISYTLLLIGIYDSTMLALGSLQLSYLLPLALGLLLGSLLCVRLLEQAMLHYPGPAYLSIMGFLLGSLLQVFPGLPGPGQWLLCPLLFTLGAALVYYFSRLHFSH